MKLFEIIKSDLAGRIGILQTNHGRIETPAFVPVVHPVKQTIHPSRLKDIGFELVITNAYITRKNYGDVAAERGIHDIIGYDGSVMTDSGGYQVLEYGGVDVTPQEMASYETAIATDIAIPLDKPTGFGLSYDAAKEYVRHTLEVCRETLEGAQDNGQIWVGPIQGSEHPDLVKESTRALIEYGYGMLALGSPVEIMESYRYRLLGQMIHQAKASMPHSVPLHLFGAGHPLTIPLAVSLGCDTFDSASYMLYARQGRYITEDGTRMLPDIREFSCPCPICDSHTPGEVFSMAESDKINSLALHNLYSIKAEVDRVKEAIHEGRLWEYVLKKSRAHPRLYETRDIFAQCGQEFVRTTPRFKNKAVFLFDIIDQHRPEILAYHEMVRRYKTDRRDIVIFAEPSRLPAYTSAQYRRLESSYGNIQYCTWNPFLGIMPAELSDIYPAAHHVTADIERRPQDYTEFARTWEIFFENNDFERMHYGDDPFLSYYIDKLDNISKSQIK